LGSRGRFRYVDARGNAITDEEKLERIRVLAIPPAWEDVWISPSPTAKLQATGVDAAARRQYLYHADFRAQQELAKFDRLIRFAERLPDLRAANAEHMDHGTLDRLRVSAIATQLISAGWFRVGSERYAKESRTFGITTLRKRHVHVRGNRIAFDFVAKHRTAVRTTLVDEELAEAVKDLLALPGGPRLFELGNTPAVARSSYVSPAVIDQYLDGRTIEDFRPRHLRVVSARNIDLDPEEQALLSLLRSWKIRQARAAA
jgi:DNA topoisomerase-1